MVKCISNMCIYIYIYVCICILQHINKDNHISISQPIKIVWKYKIVYMVSCLCIHTISKFSTETKYYDNNNH